LGNIDYFEQTSHIPEKQTSGSQARPDSRLRRDGRRKSLLKIFWMRGKAACSRICPWLADQAYSLHDAETIFSTALLAV